MKNKLLANHMEVSNQLTGGVGDYFGKTKPLGKSKAVFLAVLIAASSASEFFPSLVASNPRTSLLVMSTILVLVRIFSTAWLVLF